ncbi:chitinase [Ranunculus cassubicifolius]
MASKMLPYVLSTLLFLLHLQYSAGQSVKAGYWTPRPDFSPSSISATLFTHLFCAFADLNPTTFQVTISSANSAQFSTFTQTVQQKNPSVKTLLSIGGGDSSASSFATMATQATTRKSFIDSSITLARSNNFHGLDLDWEYPSTPQEMTNFGTLLTEWRAAVVAEASRSGKARLLLTAAVFYSSNYYSVMHPVQAISNSLDWINIMAYDFYSPYSYGTPDKTGPPAALYNPTSQVSGDTGVRAWIQSGMPTKKIVLGLPFYGHGWRLVNANNHGIFSPANGPASDGYGYGGIRDFIADNSGTTVYNSTFVTDYCYAGTTWMGYDDTQSISTKVTYAKGKALLGYFAWHVGADRNSLLAQTASRTWGAA